MTRREIMKFLGLASIFPILPEIVARERAENQPERHGLTDEQYQSMKKELLALHSGKTIFTSISLSNLPWEARKQILKEIGLVENA